MMPCTRIFQSRILGDSSRTCRRCSQSKGVVFSQLTTTARGLSGASPLGHLARRVPRPASIVISAQVDRAATPMRMRVGSAGPFFSSWYSGWTLDCSGRMTTCSIKVGGVSSHQVWRVRFHGEYGAADGIFSSDFA